MCSPSASPPPQVLEAVSLVEAGLALDRACPPEARGSGALVALEALARSTADERVKSWWGPVGLLTCLPACLPARV